MQPGWCQPIRQEFMENECEALPGVAYPGVRDNRSTINTKTGYDDDDDDDDDDDNDAPFTWNSLPADIRLCKNILTFKRHLKTNLFKLTYPPVLHQAPLYLRT